MYYRYNFTDFQKIERAPFEPYTLAQLKKYVPLTPFRDAESNWTDSTWFVYDYEKWSNEPIDFETKNDAYNALLDAKNVELYETENDL